MNSFCHRMLACLTPLADTRESVIVVLPKLEIANARHDIIAIRRTASPSITLLISAPAPTMIDGRESVQLVVSTCVAEPGLSNGNFLIRLGHFHF